MSDSKRSSRKRKHAESFSPLSRQEESSLMRALHASLRPFPANPDSSDDEIEDQDEILETIDGDGTEEEKEDESGEESLGDEKWSQKSKDIKVNFYAGPSGVTSPLPSTRRVTSFFELMFSRKIWLLLQKQTNLYANQQILTKPDPSWKKVSMGELKAWVGCLIAMGISKKPELDMYWDSTWKLPLVADRFTRDRFKKIKKYLHLVDNKALPDTSPDRLRKIRPLMEALVQNFQKNFQPSTYLTLDEDMCKFKGRNRMKQYMRAKIVKWGYRIWKVCDAETAYVLNFDVYTGATEGKVTKDLAATVAMRLTEVYQGKNRVVVMDNYYTSVPLFLDLLATSTYACGTIRPRRKYLPESIREKKNRERGEHEFWQSQNLVLTIWQDRKPVYLLSSCCETTGSDTVMRKGVDGKAREIPCPPSLKLYTQYMGGVDRSDRMVRTYSTSRRSKKWWVRLFYYCLDTALANSYILYQQSPNHPQLTYLHYVEQVAIGLIGTPSKVKRVQRSCVKKKRGKRSYPRPVSEQHFIEKTTSRLLCRYCSSLGRKKSQTIYACEICKVHLCVGKCFKLYHTGR